MLDYIVTSNHVHLLVGDNHRDCIPRSMRLVAARVAQEYNLRKGRRGAFREDRYFATAIATDGHFRRCLVYIDLNMVRAGAVRHPSHWPHSGFNEIQCPPSRYRVIDYESLYRLSGYESLEKFQSAHQQWVEFGLNQEARLREPMRTEAVAVGNASFIDSVKTRPGMRAYHRALVEPEEGTLLIEDH